MQVMAVKTYVIVLALFLFEKNQLCSFDKILCFWMILFEFVVKFIRIFFGGFLALSCNAKNYNNKDVAHRQTMLLAAGKNQKRCALASRWTRQLLQWNLLLVVRPAQHPQLCLPLLVPMAEPPCSTWGCPIRIKREQCSSPHRLLENPASQFTSTRQTRG